ncbi:cellular retinoic acid-binding protein 2-like [Ylistrum balloti]|uniref:cellular retinoic acid-binding protein 2-like n=1 Tax=Ylistrum balloti TaxID=509963 RepID=UPI002905B8AE|nr:cellular retinoic acid-binding protein 2-like [Ylistrum balloti]
MGDLSGFVGKWQEKEKRGFDDMAKKLGLNEVRTEMYKKTETVIEYKQNGDKWVMEVGILAGPPPTSYTFKLGEPYDSKDIDESPMKSLVKSNGNTFEEEHTFEDGPMKNNKMDIKREIENEQMKVTTTLGDCSFETTYAKVK